MEIDIAKCLQKLNKFKSDDYEAFAILREESLVLGYKSISGSRVLLPCRELMFTELNLDPAPSITVHYAVTNLLNMMLSFVEGGDEQ